MNFEKFVAKRLHGESNLKHSISKPILKMAIAAVSISITVMIMSIATSKGLQNKISAKVTGFTADIQISSLDLNNSLDANPFSADSTLINKLANLEGVTYVQTEITKNALIKTAEDFEGILVKGVGQNYNWNFISNHLVEGVVPSFTARSKSNQMVISKALASKLQLKLNDNAVTYFQGLKNNNALIRKFVIVGIFKTGIDFFDNQYILADQSHLQKINNWTNDQFSSLEISLNSNADKDAIYQKIETISPFDSRVRSTKEMYPQIYDWINLFDLNTLVILLIMLIVATINMVSSLLIIILERTKMIGLLKALGASQYSIRKVFLYHAFYLLRKGLFLGNIIGLTLIGIQYYFEPLQLDPTHYYVTAIPVLLTLKNWILINSVTVLICMVILIIPTLLLQKIEPVKALHYE